MISHCLINQNSNKKKEKKISLNDNCSFISSIINDNLSGINYDNSINSGNSSKKSKKDSSENESIKGDIINYYIKDDKYTNFLYRWILSFS